MRSTNELLAYLQTLDIQLWVEQGRLRFNAPQGVMNPELKAEITSHKAAIIELLSRPNLTSAPIPLVSRQQNLELSFTQRRLWFLYQLDQNIAAYLLRYNLKLKGVLNTDILEQSLTAIVNRHEILRTNFVEIEGNPFQIIHPPKPFKLPLIDLQGFVATDRETELNRLANQESQTVFNLEKDELLRVTLIRLAPQEHILLITFHHIIADAWSIGLFLRELSSLYKSFIEAKPLTLPNLPIQYVDFAQWQNQHLTKDTLVDQITYWEKQLAGIPPVLELPTDRPRPPVQTFNGGAEFFEISAELTDRLKSLSKKSGATLFMTIITTFFILLARYTGEEDIVVGIPIANRMRVEFESLMGCFVNSLVLRSQLHGNPTFLELLQQVRQTALNAYAHQDLPFEQLVEALQPERSLSHSPLFQVMFAWENVQMESLDLPNVQIEPFKTDHFTARADLNVEMMETDQSLQGLFEYNTDLFDAETIKRMVSHFQNLLEAIAINPDQKIYNLPLLTQLESQQILIDWNDTAVNYPKDTCLHELVEAQVAQTPDAIAVTYEDQQLSYQELNQKANQLAHYLRKQGIKPDQPVGICIERSLEMVIGLLAILKAGGAYVPIDPTYPKDRLAFMFADSQVSVLLTQQKLLAQLPEHTSQTLCLDSEWTLVTDESDLNPPRLSKADHLCYIIYTSGSTGKPKGAMNNHRGVVNRLLWMQSTYQIDTSDCVLQKTPFSFDVSVWEFFWTLSTGAKLVIAKPEGHKDTSYLKQLIIQAGITTLHFVPSMLQVFLEAETDLSKCSSLKRVICSGEALPIDLQRRFFERLDCELHNLYGPTEAAIDVSYWQCQANSYLSTVPIGKPVANTQLYVLDNYLQPVPIGVAGELHIGGVQVGRGYLNRPDLTAEKFIHDPFSSDPDARLYKTGDRVRYLADGAIEYLGRIDFQVKLRGFRIELGEIEALLLQHPAVNQAVVILHADNLNDKYLVAYIVPNQVDLDILELRRILRNQLPEYMVPTLFVELKAMPLTPNGKVDRRSLPAPSTSQSQFETVVEDTRTPIEDLLVSIWSNILGIKSIGIHDNFFEMGGHSLKVMQVMARVRDSFSIDLPLQTLFREPTIAGLSREITSAYQNQQGYQIPPIIPTEHSTYEPVSFAQQRMWFLQQFEPNSATYNIPIVYRVSGLLEIAILEESLTALVKRHEILRTRFISVNEQITSAIAETISLAFTVVKIDPTADSETLQRLIDTEIRQPFNLSKPPLFRVKILELTDRDRILIINFHHIITDGWSLNIFMQELADLYQSYLHNKPISLKDLPIRYVDFAVWQRQLLQGEMLRSLTNYWQKELAEPLPILNLPTDRPRPLIQTFRGATQTISLSTALTTQIKNLAQKTESTLFMILLAAFQILLARYSGQTDIIVGTPIAGRHQTETEGLIGLFVNSLAIRMDLSGNPTVEELLEKVKAVTLAAYTHQDLPLEQLIETLQIKRELSYAPLFQAMFTLLNTPSQNAKFCDDLDLTPIWSHTGTTKVDLTLGLQEIESEIAGVFEYNSDLFEPETIQRLIRHFQTLLEAIVRNPQQRITELPILTEIERQTILVEWQQTQTEYPRDKTIHQLFEAQVEKNPEATAVVYEDQQISYQELNQRANQLAHYLHKLGVSNNQPIGICVERSIDAIIGLVGILKAGGAYLPIDSDYPSDRIDYMLADAQVQILVTQQSLKSKFRNSQLLVIELDREWEMIAKESKEGLPSNTTAENIAYIIYTSGSTGEPKGVVVPHRAVNRLVINTNYIQLTSSDRVAQASNIAFDAATFEIWGALLNGAKLIGIPKEVLLSPQKLAKQIRQQQITTLFLTTALFNQVAKQIPEAFSPLRNLLFGGEASDPKAVREILEQGSPDRLLHVYGPTENTTFSSWYLVESIDEAAVTIPIGKPIANSQMYILDRDLNPIPIGVIGEIYVSGDGLAKGYLERPELTAEKFIDHRFTESDRIRLYKTGDLGRYLPDGNVEILGRSDFQVKIRGFRIELGEIETALRQQEDVRETIVIACDDARGSKQLVAYVVPKTESLTGRAIKSFLKEKLPDYMIPAFFIFLEELPLNANGKVDRRALPTPDLASPSLESSFVAPSTDTEQAIAKVWQEILKIDQIGIHDNFFELGGHSLIATQVMSRLPQIFSLDLPLSLLFELPTIAELGDRIDTILWASGDALRASAGLNADEEDEYTEGLL
ncbi:non-ribosomal peptide synthetase [Pseudanabaena sp. ABRG5-3]|uniref:non-ribosomal peptide synthetase n=1 Tax=Pseudanabaena sp. ABRG5-3 TaxID=685565 RepID=UPI000DC6DECE|nr:non-ribosomal peptide synthetase [Pseudanabaena sp. ABRG5-3]BBC27198.1 amino acid adenylation domain protein [Pseudanabaena sp. ABRG5-3]